MNEWQKVSTGLYEYYMGKERYLYNYDKDTFYYEYQNEGVVRIDFEDMNEEAREKAGDYFTSEAFKQTR